MGTRQSSTGERGGGWNNEAGGGGGAGRGAGFKKGNLGLQSLELKTPHKQLPNADKISMTHPNKETIATPLVSFDATPALEQLTPPLHSNPRVVCHATAPVQKGRGSGACGVHALMPRTASSPEGRLWDDHVGENEMGHDGQFEGCSVLKGTGGGGAFPCWPKGPAAPMGRGVLVPSGVKEHAPFPSISGAGGEILLPSRIGKGSKAEGRMCSLVCERVASTRPVHAANHCMQSRSHYGGPSLTTMTSSK